MKAASCALCAGLLLAQLAFGASVRCYICSWSPDDSNNRTDTCSDDNFQKNYVHSEDCSEGCEVFIQWDANERMEQVRRTCADIVLKEDCFTDKNVAWRRKRCTCKSDLCNNESLSGSTATVYASAVMTFLFAAAVLLSKLKLTGSV